MKTILWLAPYVPYDTVKHAGGKNLNYYINYVNNTCSSKISFIGLAYEEERSFVDLVSRGINEYIYYRDNNLFDSIVRRIISGFTLVNPWTKYCRLLLLYEYIQIIHRVALYKKSGEKPDIIILHWTAMGLILPKIKRIFPDAKYVIIEEDVSYLGLYRKYELALNNKSVVRGFFLKKLYLRLKKAEIDVVRKSDLTVTVNKKDQLLLIKDGIKVDKILSVMPCFKKYYNIDRHPQMGNIIFYGAMDREENSKSVFWFLDNVMPLLEADDEIRGKIKFFIVGAKPSKELMSKQSDTVVVTGFVESVDSFFSEAMCMVAPIVLGAGVKVKVLEAMSAGIPVLTNSIGIEGIYAENGVSYIHCEKIQEYVEGIKKLIKNPSKVEEIGAQARCFIQKNYDNEKVLGEFSKKITSLTT